MNQSTLQVITDTSTLNTIRQHCTGPLGLIPTMGNLHAGHLRLIEVAKEQTDQVWVSLFVNPTQFGAHEDFNQYPRTLEQDIEQLRSVGTDAVFIPTAETLYPLGIERHLKINIPGLDNILCGQYRPGHFSGVASVVNKLFNLVRPQKAFFGEKDYQQLLVIRTLCQDFLQTIDIIGVPTVRESNGLALSSRNQYLSNTQRALASELFKHLKQTQALLQNKTLHNQPDALTQHCKQQLDHLTELGFQPEYYEIRTTDRLTRPTVNDTELRTLLAAKLGTTRLIDNLPIHIPA